MPRYVVALEIAGTSHVSLAARDAATALTNAFDVVRRHDVDDWWPRLQTADFIAPRAAPASNAPRSFEVSLPLRHGVSIGFDRSRRCGLHQGQGRRSGRLAGNPRASRGSSIQPRFGKGYSGVAAAYGPLRLLSA